MRQLKEIRSPLIGAFVITASMALRRGAVCREFQRGEATESDVLREAIGEMVMGVPAGSGNASVLAG
ncbi:MAG: hypothetical protein ABSE70_02680 [Candidatus Limnocylindrales bacterium]